MYIRRKINLLCLCLCLCRSRCNSRSEFTGLGYINFAFFLYFFADNSQALDHCIKPYLTFIYRDVTLLIFGLSLHLICNNFFCLCGEGFDEKLRLRPLVAEKILNILKLLRNRSAPAVNC